MELITYWLDYYEKTLNDELDDDVLQELKKNIIDTLCGPLTVFDLPYAKNLYTFAKDFQREEGAIIWGSEIKTDIVTAVYVNCSLSRFRDLVNTYIAKRCGGHTSDNISVALTLGQYFQSRAEDVLRAVYTADL